MTNQGSLWQEETPDGNEQPERDAPVGGNRKREVLPVTTADAASDQVVIAQVYAVVRAIPSGRVMSYGGVGARCNPPISGYICGRIMQGAHRDVPWWRVVGKEGALPIRKRNPLLEQEQRARLVAEGVSFDAGGRVTADRFTF